MPDLGQTTSEAKVLHWHKRVGDRVSKGEALVEVETDKVDMDVECFVDGFLRETLVPEQSMAVALKPVAILTDAPDEEYEAVAVESSAEVDEAPPPQRAARKAERAHAAPAARKRAAELGVDLGLVSGTGPNGMVTRKDVDRFSARLAADDGSPGARVRSRRAAMAALVQQSKREIPHFYVRRRLVLTNISERRESWNRSHPNEKLTWNDVFVRAVSFALVDVPELNQRLVGDVCEAHARPDVLVTVAVEGGLSLVPASAPALQDLETFAVAIRSAVDRQGKSAEAGAAPCFAVSNLGMHGVEDFTAIIPPNCCAILAVGEVSLSAVVRDGAVVALPGCHVTLSVDHRIADGVAAARFLARLDHHLSSREAWV